MSRKYVSTEFDGRRISVIIHHSASDKLAVVHSSCLFGAESNSGQRERKSVWQGFQSKICELVYGKLSKLDSIHGTNILHTALLPNNGHKIYLSGPFWIFYLYVILTISYLWAQTIETSSLPTHSSRPLFWQIKIFFWHTDRIYQL